MDWRIYAFCFITLMFFITYFHVEAVAKILGIALIGELIILMIFSFAVVVQGGGPDGLVWQALNPASIFSGGEGVEGAARVFGVGLAGVGFFACFWSWVGFEMAPNYAEESRNPKKMMAAAIYISCIGLGILYTFWSWMLISAYGSTNDEWVWAVATSYGAAGDAPPISPGNGLPEGNYANVFYPAAGVRGNRHRERLQGVDHHRLVRLRARLLADVQPLHLRHGTRGHPPARPRPHAREAQEPVRRDVRRRVVRDHGHRALRHRRRRRRTARGGRLRREQPAHGTARWHLIPFQGNALLFPLMAVVGLAIMVYFWREARDGWHWWKTCIAPILGAGAISFAFYLMMRTAPASPSASTRAG